MSEVTSLPANFVQWLKNKNENDYWYASDVPQDFAIKKFHYYSKALKEKSLQCKQVTWFITNKCDLSCVHCGVSANERAFSELTLEQFITFIPKLKKIGVEYITLSGGEPLVRKDAPEIISTLKKYGFKLGMVTNGSKVKKLCQNMTEYKLDSISISIDGMEKNHSLIRKSKSNFQKAIESIKTAKEAGVKIVAVSTCVYPHNIEDLELLKETIFSNGADQWILRPITPSGRAFEKSDYFMNHHQIKNLLYFATLNLLKGYDVTVGADLGYLGKLDSSLYSAPYFCSVGWNSMIILPNGDIKGFDEAHLPYEGNLLTDDLEEIWFNGFKYYREPNLPETCYQCEYFISCRGGYIPGAEMGRRCLKPVLKMFEEDAQKTV